MKSIPYGRQHITDDDINAVVETLQHDYLTTGPKVKEFEDKFAQYIGSKHAVAVSNGTAALHLCAMAAKVNKDTHVITSPITFSASANCVRYCGGTVHFADINPSSLTIDLDELEKLINSKPEGFFSGIIPVDMAGFPVNMEELKKLATKHKLWIIEDACHAPGGWFRDSQGKRQNCGNGNFAEMAIFSFHPVKHIACGEGGMITTNDPDLYSKLVQLRSHGMIYQGNPGLEENHGGWYMEMHELGYNYRIPDILCALGISQLERADLGLERRKQIAGIYDIALRGHVEIKSLLNDAIGHAYHLYIIEIEDRKGLYEYLRQHKIFAQVHYIPVHLMPYYKALGHKKGDFPNAEAYYERGISLPMYPSITGEEQEYVIRTILDFIKK